MLSGRWLEAGLPQNIPDHDFTPESTELPPLAADTEQTPVAFLLCKVKLAVGLGNVLREVDGGSGGTGEGTPYSRILDLDGQLRATYGSLPVAYQVRSDSLRMPVTDPMLAVGQIILANIFHKSLCVLHSKHLRTTEGDGGGGGGRFAYSRVSCIESAMTLLKFQDFLSQEVEVNGRMRRLNHFLTSLSLHDYFLAATLLCTALFVDEEEGGGGGAAAGGNLGVGGPSRDDMITALEKSAATIGQMQDESVEARRACKLLRLLLDRLQNPAPTPSAPVDVGASFEGTSYQRSSLATTQTHAIELPHFMGGGRSYDQNFGVWGIGPDSLQLPVSKGLRCEGCVVGIDPVY